MSYWYDYFDYSYDPYDFDYAPPSYEPPPPAYEPPPSYDYYEPPGGQPSQFFDDGSPLYDVPYDYGPDPGSATVDTSYDPFSADTYYDQSTGQYEAAPEQDYYSDPYAYEQGQSEYQTPEQFNMAQEAAFEQGYTDFDYAPQQEGYQSPAQDEPSGVDYQDTDVSGAGQTRGLQSTDGVQYADALQAMTNEGTVSDSVQNNMKLAEASPNFTPTEGGATSNASGSNIAFNADGSATVVTPSGARVDLSADQAQALLSGNNSALSSNDSGTSEQFGSTRVATDSGLSGQDLSPQPDARAEYLAQSKQNSDYATGVPVEDRATTYTPAAAAEAQARDARIAAYEAGLAPVDDRSSYAPVENTKGYWNEAENVWVPSEYGTNKEAFDTSGMNEVTNSRYDPETNTYYYKDENGKEQIYQPDTMPEPGKSQTGRQVMDKAEGKFTPQVSMQGGSKGSGGGGGGGGSRGQQSGKKGGGSSAALLALLAALAASRSGGDSKAAVQSGIPSLALARTKADLDAKRRAGSGAQRYYNDPGVGRAMGGPINAFAGGGISSLGGYSDGGRLLRGPGDGVSDSIPATIGKKQPARLADGEFVVPARIVSELGNGSTEAGARKLYEMMDRVQKARRKTTGKNAVARNTRAHKLLPR